MQTTPIRTRYALVALLLVLAAGLRLLTPYLGTWNFSPVTAMGIFGVAYFRKQWLAWLLPFAALWLSNLALNNILYAQYYDGFQWFGSIWHYLPFLAVMAFAALSLRRINPMGVAGTAIGASLLFFLISNLGVWLAGGMYAPDAAGLLACYVAALPFYPATLLGDLLFSALLFGAFEWASRRQAPSAA